MNAKRRLSGVDVVHGCFPGGGDSILITLYRCRQYGFSDFLENFHISYCTVVDMQCSRAHPASRSRAF